MCRQLVATNSELFLTLFKTHTWPHLEVHNVVVPSLFKTDINLTNHTPKRVTKLVIGLNPKSYVDRLQHLRLSSPSYSRIRDDLVMAYSTSNIQISRAYCQNFVITLLEATLERLQIKKPTPRYALTFSHCALLPFEMLC